MDLSFLESKAKISGYGYEALFLTEFTKGFSGFTYTMDFEGKQNTLKTNDSLLCLLANTVYEVYIFFSNRGSFRKHSTYMVYKHISQVTNY